MATTKSPRSAKRSTTSFASTIAAAAFIGLCALGAYFFASSVLPAHAAADTDTARRYAVRFPNRIRSRISVTDTASALDDTQGDLPDDAVKGDDTLQPETTEATEDAVQQQESIHPEIDESVQKQIEEVDAGVTAQSQADRDADGTAEEEKQQEVEVEVEPEGLRTEVSSEGGKTWATQAAHSTDENERRKEEASSDGGGDTGEWELCKVTAGADYIPCLDNEEAIKKLHRINFEHRERHCPKESPTCLVPLPDGYKRPIEWPQSRNKIWYNNVPHTKLAEVKGHQNWVKVTGEYLTFPGGGTQFIHGALHYIDFIQKIKVNENMLYPKKKANGNMGQMFVPSRFGLTKSWKEACPHWRGDLNQSPPN